MTKKISSLVSANLLNVGLSAINGIYIARMIGPENRGILALLLTLTMVMSVLLSLGVPHASAYFIRSRPNAILLILKYIFIVQFIGFVFAFGSFLLLRDFFATVFLDGYFIDFRMVVLLTFSILFSAGNGALASCVIAKGDTKYYALGANTGAFITLVATISYFVFLGKIFEPLHAVIFASIVGYAMTTVVYRLRFISYTKEVGLNDNNISWREFFRFGWHSQIGALSSLTFKKIDIFIVGYLLNPQSVGFYTIALSLRDLGLIIPRAIAGLLGGEIADSTKPKEYKLTILRKYLIFSGAVGFAAGVFAYFVFPFLIPLVYGDAFMPSVNISIIVIFSLVPMSMAIVLGSAFSGLGVPLKASIASIWASAISVPVIFLLVFRFEIIGAAISTIASTVVLFLMLNQKKVVN